MKGKDSMGIWIDVTGRPEPSEDTYDDIRIEPDKINDRPALGDRWFSIILNGEKVATLTMEVDDAALGLHIMPADFESEAEIEEDD
jgi:hypothetical protein